jgi:integrase
MRHVNFHDLRRSCGTILLQSGVPLNVVSKILGHSTTKVTEKRYAFMHEDCGARRHAQGVRRLNVLHHALHNKEKGRPEEVALFIGGWYRD